MSKALEILEQKYAYHINLVRINTESAEEHRIEAEKYKEAIQEHKEFLEEKAAREASDELNRIVGGAS